MADVFVYAPDCEDFDNIGEAGSLTPISCEPTEIGNGMWDLELVHPIDEMGKWSYLQNGYILVAEVPVRTLPEIGEDGMLVTSVENWTVKLGASGGARRVWNKKSGGKVISTSKNKPKPGAKVTVVAKATNRYKIKFRKGSGWIAISALENKVDVTIPNTASGIEQEAPAWSIRPQRFRIYKVEKTDDAVTVLAKHIFYDQAGNITSYSADNPTCIQALAGLIAGRIDKPSDFATDPDIVGRTNIVGTRVGVKWTRARFTEALLDPETGLVNRWGAKLIRDDEEFCVLVDAGIDRGVTIEYGKNLIGVQLDLDYSQIVTRYIPIGQTSKGKPLELAPGTYSTDHGTIVIPAGAKWVDAPNIGDYPIPLMEVLDLGSEAKAAGTSDAQIKDAREKMIDACLYKWEREQTNYPAVTLNVDFAQLGDTEEYVQYRQLENLYMFDPTRIRHPGIDIDLKAEVVEMTWDSLRDRAAKITVGKVNPATVGSKLPSWQLPATIPGESVAPGTLGNGAFDDNVPIDLDLTNNPTVAEVAQQYVRNAWITGAQVFRYAAGASTPTPTSIAVTANLQNVLMDRWQYKDSGGIWTDYPTGDGNTTINATALVVKPGHAVWVDNICTLRLLTTDPAIIDTFNLYQVYDGATGATGASGVDGLTAILSNAAHALPKTTDGTVSYTGSGTTLRLFEGASELSYDGTGLANGTYKVTPSATGITCGSLSDSGTYLTVGNHSAMTGNTASITYNITGKRQNGAAISLSVTQTLSVAQQGAPGANGVSFGVYAPNGSVFNNQVGTLTLQAAGYDGANQITSGATYVWKKHQAGSWVAISGATSPTLTVSGADVIGLQAFRCEMTYGGVTYTDTITLTDKTDSFQSGIQSTGGNSFRNGVGKTCLTCRIWQNAQEIDALKSATMSETAPSSPATGAFWYNVNPATPQVALMRWSGSTWQDVTTNPTYAHIKSYTWYRRDRDGNALDGGLAFATGKVIYADGDDVDQSTTFSCEVE